ncbi:MAG: SHOCT domain-containing protein [Microbacterium sp.]|uniref:SHOCT domain-containing protein n=1 Tax=Microbacterium sp. TaxID=51671 RepID=UPI001AD48A46|nr:SHOCT domain-containing protein [Microbacterium sp.]MBN9214761.1 SHOCT domain-containing protein [Microbacterium sp.]
MCTRPWRTAGSIARYPDIAKIATAGVFFGKAGVFLAATGPDKKVDDRELYLYVRGTRHHWVAQVDPDRGDLARKFAANMNSTAQKLGPVPAAPAARTAAPTPSKRAAAPMDQGIAAQLKSLSDLHSAGRLSDEEYRQAKARALGQ